MAGEWLAQLPDDLKANEAFTSFATLGDFAKSHLEARGKLSETDGKLKELQEEYDGFMENAIPKLPDDATDEERGLYFKSLGRPDKPEEYEFDGEDKNAPEWTNQWKQQFHSLGLTKTQAKALSAAFNASMTKMVEAHNAALKQEMTAAETKLRSEMGDKFDANVELAKRMTQKHLGADFDKTFANLSGEGRFGVVRLLLKVASLTGEDTSPKAGTTVGGGGNKTFISYDKSPAPPKKG